MLFGDLMTVVQQSCRSRLPSTTTASSALWKSSKRPRGCSTTFTKLKNPNFPGVARALGLWGQTVSDADQLEAGVKDWLAQPGPALLHVHVNPMHLAPVHAGRAGNRDGALFDARHPAWPGRRCLGDGEGEFPLVEALFWLTDAQRPAAWNDRDRCSCAALADCFAIVGTGRNRSICRSGRRCP
jgi:Thiamine pyrophosphate enzyme, C-terminal TPP binding domain